MQGQGGKTAFVLLLLAISALAEVQVSLLDGSEEKYLRPTVKPSESLLDDKTFSGLASALLNLEDTVGLNALQSQQINEILQANPFKRPKALLVLALAGIDQDLSSGGGTPLMKAEDNLLQGFANLKSLESVEQIQLDTANIPGCGEACLEQLLLQSIADLGLNSSYSPVQNPLRGVWTIRSEQGQINLDLAELSDRLFALEVASFCNAVRDTVGEMRQRDAQGLDFFQRAQLLSRTFISPHMIREAYGASSKHYEAVLQTFRVMLASAIERLQLSSKGRLVTFVVGVDKVTESQQNDIWALTAPTSPLSASRRKLLQGSSNSDSDFLKNFVAWVSMWGTFFLLLFFALTGCHCLKSMKFKQDSLLYGKNKSD